MVVLKHYLNKSFKSCMNTFIIHYLQFSALILLTLPLLFWLSYFLYTLSLSLSLTLSLSLSLTFFISLYLSLSLTLSSCLTFMLLGCIPSPAPKTIYYGHVTSLLVCPLLPLEIYVLLMNVCDMHEKVSSFQRNAIINENNINSPSKKK